MNRKYYSENKAGLWNTALEDEHLNHGDDAPCIQIRALVSGLSNRFRRTRYLLMAEIIQAVIDESGYTSAEPRDLFVFAGYLGPVKAWEDFTHAWDRIIGNDEDLKSPQKSKKLFEWTGSRSDPRVLALIEAVHDSGLKSVRWKIRYEEHLSLFPNSRNMYFIGWLGFLSHLMAEVRLIPDLSLRFYYDRNHTEEERIQAEYRSFYAWAQVTQPDWCTALPYRPAPEDDATFWPLRAAHALAFNEHRADWHLRKTASRSQILYGNY